MKSKWYDLDDFDRAYYPNWTAVGGFTDRFRREQNGKQNQADFVQMWAGVSAADRISWNHNALGTGYSGFSMFVDHCCFVGQITTLANNPARFDFCICDYGTYG